MKGVTAAGCIATAEAGAYAFKKGGNAVDAIIAAQLCACVSEPLLTGLTGAGMAMIKVNNSVIVLDCFTTLPKRQIRQEPKLVPIQFGSVVQDFYVGWGSISVPGLPRGLAELHRKYGTLPIKRLVEPALDAAKNGVPITKGMAKVLELLTPIFMSNSEMRSMLFKNDEPLKEGANFYNPLAVQDLLEYSNNPWGFLCEGEYAKRLGQAPVEMSITHEDCQDYKPLWREPIQVDFHGEKLYLPPPPSTGGVMIQHALNSLKKPPPYTKSECINALLTIAEIPRNFLDKEVFNRSAGFTTHISVSDEKGNLAAITSSLGESAGEVLHGTGLVMNNFLGESDVYPYSLRPIISSGKRLITMCSPTILETSSNVTAMGAGGSSRIRSAIFHGIHQSVLGKPLTEIVQSSRVHCEEDDIYLESFDLTDKEKANVENQFNKITYFDEYGIFFGGLNMSRWDKHTGLLSGASDPRRSGMVAYNGM